MPGGHFNTHRDPYAHLFYCLSGSGLVTVAGEQMPLVKGSCIEIEAGVDHAYYNNGDDELMLISMNLPVPPEG